MKHIVLFEFSRASEYTSKNNKNRNRSGENGKIQSRKIARNSFLNPKLCNRRGRGTFSKENLRGTKSEMDKSAQQVRYS